ncbi:hypothetical protein [Nodosilinea sp. PGN35]|uniref:hypothetical protein n=1 Tax=Nodosilinea sp. PGN35 TaxID=3020489 RepID=UPI0023B2FA6C|nr:hypothetical protein [Nodosilinea sp. TSF1-S3]MDF0366748.1 hypothetical protein [Nodosilinea sp. TSF1-S3]
METRASGMAGGEDAMVKGRPKGHRGPRRADVISVAYQHGGSAAPCPEPPRRGGTAATPSSGSVSGVFLSAKLHLWPWIGLDFP